MRVGLTTGSDYLDRRVVEPAKDTAQELYHNIGSDLTSGDWFLVLVGFAKLYGLWVVAVFVVCALIAMVGDWLQGLFRRSKP